jgi:dipeptidyl aminopeptidase
MFGSWRLSADMKYILVGADVRKQWRHSSTGNYYIHEISTKITRAVVPPSNPPKIAYATWSPTGDALAYVHSNDLYVMPSPSEPAIRVTSSGNASLFHGVPDWVYEEEVFSSDYALWWSPDSASVAFLRLDETKVAEYSFPVYNPTENASMVVPYPDETVMKYPKPGYDNPLVSVHVFEVSRYVNVSQVTRPAPLPEKYTSTLTWPGAQEPADQVIQEVTWVGSHSLIVKEVNRAATNGSVVLFDLSASSFASRSKGAVVRRLGVDGPEADEGWIDASQTVFPLPAALLPSGAGSAYLDIVPSPQGYNHLALFSPASSSTPIFLTNGTWEVIGPIQAVDVLGRVWYQAAAPSSIERHIYSIALPSASHPALASSPEVFTSSADAGPSNKDVGFYTASFSPKGGFALLNYGGPNVPWQRIISTVPVKKDGEKEKEKIDILVTDNKNLNQTLLEFDLPIITRLTIENDGVGTCAPPINVWFSRLTIYRQR